MEPLALHHVAVPVTDLDEAVDFYVRVLGLTLRPERPHGIGAGAWLSAGAAPQEGDGVGSGQQVHLTVGTPTTSAGAHFALLVRDVDAAAAELRGHGVPVSAPTAVGAARQAFLSDPSGNAVELHEAAPESGSNRPAEAAT